MKRCWACVLAIGMTAGFASGQMQTKEFVFPLEGVQEVPPSGSPATGTCTIFLDGGAMTIDVDCSYQGLVGTPTAAHIHGPALAGQNAGVQIALTPVGAPSGTINHVGMPVTPQQMQDMLDGLHYVNLHTTTAPGGEIRGQVVQGPPVPTVSQWGVILLGAMLLGVGAVTLKRRSRAATA